jgi:putative hemolysin
MNKATIAAIFSALAVSAYAQPVDETTANAPNPAAVYCIKIGGKLRIEKSPQGDLGICMLPDGTEIEEWELFRRDHPQTQQG